MQACSRLGVWAMAVAVWLLAAMPVLAAGNTHYVYFSVNGLALQAELHENTGLLEKIDSNLPSSSQQLFKGSFPGYPDSSIRVALKEGRWRGVMVVEGQLHVIDATVEAQNSLPRFSAALQTEQFKPNHEQPEVCMAHGGTVATSAVLGDFQVASSVAAAATVADICANPIDGVCLLPELELAYDSSYQSLPSPGETAYERALRELNEMELFFDVSFGFQFSRLSLTMLNPAQDAAISSTTDPETLLDDLQLLRQTGQLPYLQNPRSIFHFVTGRDLATSGGANVVGIAFLDTVCDGTGFNTGLTDAGGTSLVSLVMAHEIGHNLGSEHDGDPGYAACPQNTHVMSPSLSIFNSISSFSSCSVNAIQQSIAADLSTACFDFPIDIGLAAHVDNPQSPSLVDAFDSRYQINVDDGYVQIGGIVVDGAISDPAEGMFIYVEIDGGSCTFGLDSYQCTVSNPPPALELRVTASVDESAVEFTMQHAISTSTAHVIDVVPGNNMLVETLNSFGASSGEPPPQPNAAGKSGGSSGGSSGGGGGGGGSAQPLGVLMMLFVTICRLCRRQRA